MPATETLLQGATQALKSLTSNYTAGGGTIQVGSSIKDNAGVDVPVPFEILVGRNRPNTERRYFVVSAMTGGGALTVAASPAYTDNQNFSTGDFVDVISAWETQRRLRAFALLHTHGTGVDGSQVNHTGLSNIGSNTHAQIDTHISATAAHGATGAVVGTTNTQTLQNKKVGDGSDATKAFAFDTSGATTAKTATLKSSHTNDRTLTFPDATDTLVGKATSDTLTNKTLTTPTIGDYTNGQHNHGSAAAGGAIVAAALPGTIWTTWAPGGIAQSGALTFTTTYARYRIIDKMVHVEFLFAFTNAGTAANAIVLTIPAALTAARSSGVVGTFLFADQSVAWYQGTLYLTSSTTVIGAIHNGTAIPGGIGVNPNFAVASGDVYSGTMQYEGA